VNTSLGSGAHQARVLLVLEQPALVELIRLTLNHGVNSTRAIATAAEVKTSVAAWLPHLLLLDMDLDGTQIMALINHKTLARGRLPVIGLTRRGDLKTKLAAFEAGVDDILTVPFAPEELLARVIAVPRRSYRDAVTFTPIIKIGELEIDILKRTVRAGTSELHLTSLEQSLLYLLAANAGRVITREEILVSLWGTDYVAESNVVDRQIRNLRARLQDDWREPHFIATVPRRGYRFLLNSSCTDPLHQWVPGGITRWVGRSIISSMPRPPMGRQGPLAFHHRWSSTTTAKSRLSARTWRSCRMVAGELSR
jgi:DNA-binding response OmpR family regulator